MKKQLLTLATFLGISASAASGQLLTSVEVEVAGSLGGTISLALAAGGDVLIAVAFANDAINSFERDDVTGLLSFADFESDGEDGVNGLNQVNGVAVSPDGHFAYASSRQDDSIAVFSVSPTGDLGFVQVMLNTPNGPADGIWQNKGAGVSPDGAYVVGSGRTDPGVPRGAVALFARHATLGTVTFLSLVKNGVTPGVNALGAGGKPIFSSDGLLYLVSPVGNSVTTFSIDTSTNPDRLAFESVVVNNVGGVTGIGGATSIVFSASEEDAYVTSATGVAHFSRNTTTGELNFVEAFVDGAGGLDGLGGATHAVLNVAGDRLYVAAALDDAVAVLARAADGGLTYIGFVQDGVGGLDGLAGAAHAVLSGDGNYLYVAAAGESAVGVFERGTGGPGGGDAADFGDAPDPTFPTLLASDGARHAITDGVLHLGALLDAELEGQPDALASADDTGLVDDEDGVTFVDPLTPGLTADIEVSASAPALLDAWIDWNDDGDWADAGERIANATAVIAGTNTVNVSVSATAVVESVVVARFRLSTAGVAGPGGPAADGEVEDYAAAIGPVADLSVTPSPDSMSDWGMPFSMTITVSNAGGSDVTGAGVAIAMNASASAVTWTCVATNGVCTAAGAGDVADSVDLDAGGSALYTISGTVTSGDPGHYVTASGTVTAPPGTPDPQLGNNAGVARVLIATIFVDGFESGDTSAWSLDAP